jgi:3-oxoacyl-ACP reductase-like protein
LDGQEVKEFSRNFFEKKIGTGLMEGNNMVAQGVEQLGMRTFSQSEMAYTILGNALLENQCNPSKRTYVS